jgi:hypothetical protein
VSGRVSSEFVDREKKLVARRNSEKHNFIQRISNWKIREKGKEKEKEWLKTKKENQLAIVYNKFMACSKVLKGLWFLDLLK